MKSYRLWLILPAVVLILWAVKVYANTMQLNTYYPAPTGYYDSVKVKSGLQLPCHSVDAPSGVQTGWIWIAGTAGSNCGS